jgi:hypothetical protein
MVIAVGIAFISCVRAETYDISYILPRFDFQHIQTSGSILIILSVLPDPKNMGIAATAVGISVLS